MAGILHDVVDDTCESLQNIEREFGDDVAKLVAGVSRLSYINQVFFFKLLVGVLPLTLLLLSDSLIAILMLQLLRRHRRINVGQGNFGQEEV